MQKQITYPKFIPRIFATMLDLCILSIFLTPIMNIIAQNVFVYSFQDFFIANEINTNDMQAMSEIVKTPEFVSQVTGSKTFIYVGTLFAINTLIMGVYFVTFWKKFGATPGKFIMRMRVVNVTDYSSPSIFQLIGRFLGYITAIIGMWSMVFSKQGLALHDKISGTIVIKR